MEVWEDVQGWLGCYKVSSTGVLRSLPRGRSKGKVISTQLSKDGYVCVKLTSNGRNFTTKMHRLVAKAFIPNPDNKPTVNHINGIKTDNRVENLEWADRKEQVVHAYKNGLYPSRAGIGNSHATINEAQAREIFRLRRLGADYKTLASLFDTSYKAVTMLCLGYSWIHLDLVKDIPLK